jgi:hypothetical protein
MRFVIGKIKSKFSALNSSGIESFRASFGQSAILSSRAMSGNFRDLWDAEVKVYSQWGEDGILDYLCERIGLSKPRMLEVGAGNFDECNSRFLAENRNANVLAVDGREDLISSIESSPLHWKSHIVGLQTWVTPENINEIIAKAHKAIGQPDIFSLDLDGNDYWILEAANLSSILIVVVEYNPLFGHKNAVTVPRDDKFDRTSKHYSWLYYGASLKAFTLLLEKKGFAFVGTNRVGNNAFFVSKDIVNLIPTKISQDYSVYTDWRVRETRAKSGVLNFVTGYDRVITMMDQKLIDIETGAETSVGEANPA